MESTNFYMPTYSNNLTVLMLVGLMSIDVYKFGELVADISSGPEILEALYKCDPSLTFSFDRYRVML